MIWLIRNNGEYNVTEEMTLFTPSLWGSAVTPEGVLPGFCERSWTSCSGSLRVRSFVYILASVRWSGSSSIISNNRWPGLTPRAAMIPRYWYTGSHVSEWKGDLKCGNKQWRNMTGKASQITGNSTIFFSIIWSGWQIFHFWLIV